MSTNKFDELELLQEQAEHRRRRKPRGKQKRNVDLDVVLDAELDELEFVEDMLPGKKGQRVKMDWDAEKYHRKRKSGKTRRKLEDDFE